MKSKRSAISAESNCRDHKPRSENESDPKTWRAQISPGRELDKRIDCHAAVSAEIESVRRETKHAFFEQIANVRSIERDLFKYGDGYRRQRSPKKCRAPDPTGDEQRPAINRRLPERDRDPPVNEHHPISNPRNGCPC